MPLKMRDSEEIRFRANAGVKDIVGRGLIYDDNIAVIELIKNAKDADATRADIRFSNETKLSSKSSIIISDNGKGMSRDDIINKWLNIAYSEKKGTLHRKKASFYAGNKGVGRFSCDRLGSKLALYTRTEKGDFQRVIIDWTEFEGRGQDEEISSIPLKYDLLDRKDFLEEVGDSSFSHGTVLVIKDLRSIWDAKKLKKLISELEKFSPSVDEGFSIYLRTDSNYENDKDLSKKLNKKIENNILSKLSFKTTHIKSKIDKDGILINTSLYYQGQEVYNYTAKNPYLHLKNIAVEVHFLDPLSKAYFTRTVGISPNQYGSIFLFYNGFRVSPYGNDKNDWLNLDQRKSQGTARYLGTREVFGRIDIIDKDEAFSVVTSREGLAHNSAYRDLVAFDQDEKTSLSNGKESYGFVTVLIRQLENFVVSGLDWHRLFDRLAPNENKVVTIEDVKKDPNRFTLRPVSQERVKEACDRLLKSDWKISEFEVNDELIAKISAVAEDKFEQFVADFVGKIERKSLKDLSASQIGNFRKIIEHEKEKVRIAQADREYAEKKLVVEEKRRLFAESHFTSDSQRVANLQHLIGIWSEEIQNNLEKILKSSSDNKSLSVEDVIEGIRRSYFLINKVSKLSQIITKANFDMISDRIKQDIFSFIEQYIEEIESLGAGWNISIIYNNPNNIVLPLNMSPLEVSMLIDNAISNADLLPEK